MNFLQKIFGDAVDLFSGLAPAATAQGLAAALTPIAGSKPQVNIFGDYAEIVFSPEQEDRITEWILTQLRREPGPVRMDAAGIATKVLARQYWPYVLGVSAAGFALGYLVTKKER